MTKSGKHFCKLVMNDSSIDGNDILPEVASMGDIVPLLKRKSAQYKGRVDDVLRSAPSPEELAAYNLHDMAKAFIIDTLAVTILNQNESQHAQLMNQLSRDDVYTMFLKEKAKDILRESQNLGQWKTHDFMQSLFSNAWKTVGGLIEGREMATGSTDIRGHQRAEK